VSHVLRVCEAQLIIPFSPLKIVGMPFYHRPCFQTFPSQNTPRLHRRSSIHHRRFLHRFSPACASFRTWDTPSCQRRCRANVTSFVAKAKPISWSIGVEIVRGDVDGDGGKFAVGSGEGKLDRGLGVKNLGLERRLMPRM
jgi:hypothetical protein